MNFAVIRCSGKQYLVRLGDKIAVNNLKVGKSQKVNFNEVLLTANSSVKVGTPLVKKVEIVGKVIRNFKGSKLTVTKFKPKSRYLRRTGFRPSLTEVEIEKIKLGA